MQQFSIAGALYALPAMLVCGLLTTYIVTQAMVDRYAESISLVLGTATATFNSDNSGSTTSSEFLQRLAGHSDFTARFPYITVWGREGEIRFSNIAGLDSSSASIPAGVARALSGVSHADFSDMQSADFRETGLAVDFLEIFVPLRDPVSGEVDAAVQLRESTAPIETVLVWVTLSTWGAVVGTSALVVAGLYVLVSRGSRTIERQQKRLTKRLKLSQELARRYRQLKEQAQRLSRNVTSFADDHLRTVGTDLHDGPAQAIALAMLQLEQARRSSNEEQRLSVLKRVETTLSEALHDMRDIAAGLVLPELEQMTVPEIVSYAIDLHSGRTGTVVQKSLSIDSICAPSSVAVCTFRFVQEGLNNAFHHGLAEGVTVAGSLDGGILKLSVLNRYAEGAATARSGGKGLGQHGLRARVQSIGGNFLFAQEHGFARMEMWLDMRRLQQQ